MALLKCVDGRTVQMSEAEEAAHLAEIAAHALPDTLEAIRRKRGRVVDQGVMHNGQRWQTNTESQSAMATAVILAQAYEAATQQPWSTNWKTASGFTTVNLTQLITAGLVVGGFVQAAFAREAALSAQAAGGDIAGALAALNTGWPESE